MQLKQRKIQLENSLSGAFDFNCMWFIAQFKQLWQGKVKQDEVFSTLMC